MPEPRDVQFVDLAWLLEMTHDQYLERFRGTAVRRAKSWMLQRNAAVALGNTGGPDATEPLLRAVRENPHPVVRGHAAWAVGAIAARHHLRSARHDLQSALEAEADESVRAEILAAIEDIDNVM